MHLLLLALISSVLLLGGFLFNCGEAMANEPNYKVHIISAWAVAAGLVGLAISLCWLLKIIWEAL